MSSSIGVAGKPNIPAAGCDATSSRVRKAPVIATILVLVFAFAGVLCFKYWPFSETAVRQDLAEASDSTVTIGGYHATYFPPGCTLEGVQFHHGPNQFKLITINNLLVEGSYMGILTRHVPRVTALGARVFIPPFGGNVQFHSQHSTTVIDELIGNGTVVEFLSSDRHTSSLVFDVHEALLRSVRWGSPIHYRLKLHNPNPPGEILVEGKFGAWADGHPQDTPMSGIYTFEHADLGVYGGIGGTLNSTGTFDGVLKHINVSGTTDTPDFVVTSGGHVHGLSTRFDAYVDATHGDTFLNKVEAQIGRTTLLARGKIAGTAEDGGKLANLHFTSRHGRIEDILGMFVTAPRSPMSGDLSFVADSQFANKNEPFLESVQLQAKFGIADGSFKPDTQEDVNALSAGARGQSKDAPETILSGLKGTVDLSRGVGHFSTLDFQVPGANAHLHGTFNVTNFRIDLHGDMKVDTNISKTTTGVKSLLLKVMDPFFRKKKKGEIVPVHILGTYEKPQFGIDVGTNQKTK
ncbi:MAG TPA: AsmA-like C-terminal region-containing protein [Candidatus Sulfotelmatobacter sp.]|nr:AsmA-like C-terminal region-containing protein [Candidatus Sulfotelmatobacter sp.]